MLDISTRINRRIFCRSEPMRRLVGPLRITHDAYVKIGACGAYKTGTDDGGVAAVAGVVDVHDAAAKGYEAMVWTVLLGS